MARRFARHSPLAQSSPILDVTVYRPAISTLYGEGFFGSTTACGQVLTRHMLGVANRTLPCGTMVDFVFHGRTIAVPVIDRGPYANHADWDLTEATGRALGITGTETVGAVNLRPAAWFPPSSGSSRPASARDRRGASPLAPVRARP